MLSSFFSWTKYNLFSQNIGLSFPIIIKTRLYTYHNTTTIHLDRKKTPEIFGLKFSKKTLLLPHEWLHKKRYRRKLTYPQRSKGRLGGLPNKWKYRKSGCTPVANTFSGRFEKLPGEETGFLARPQPGPWTYDIRQSLLSSFFVIFYSAIRSDVCIYTDDAYGRKYERKSARPRCLNSNGAYLASSSKLLGLCAMRTKLREEEDLCAQWLLLG